MSTHAANDLTIPELANVSELPPAVHDVTQLSPFAFPRPNDDVVRASNIMIVDDEVAITRLVRKYLKDAGFQNFQTINEAAEAIEAIESALPDLVLLDVRMKPINGLEILEHLRRDERTQQIPVIILTSAANENVKIAALNLGANDFLTKPVCVSELLSRVRNTLSVKAYRDIVADYSLQLESDVLRDELTGIPNRRAFEYELKRRMSEWNRQRASLSLLMVDLDHFKSLNDRYGHLTGDIVLREVAQKLSRSVRDMDLVARYGGEEFGIILPAVNSHETQEAAERIRVTINDHPLVVEDQQLELTVCVGAAHAMNGDDADLLVRRADSARYTAKRNGRNCSFLHDGAYCVAIRRRDNRKPTRCNFWREYQAIDTPIESSKIAIVEDETSTVHIVRKYLKDAGFTNFVEVTDATAALRIIHDEQPDLVLLDINMPQVSGLDILEQLRKSDARKMIPVIIFTSSTEKQTKVAALNLGANDFLQKPVDPSELLARVRNTLLAKSHVDNLAEYSNKLEHEVSLRTTELSASRREAIQCLARAAELRDDQTGKHVLRVGRYAAIIAEEVGFSKERILWMEHAAQLHDVGKIGVPDAILNKKGRLNSSEWEVMKAHCLDGTRILEDNANKGEASRNYYVENGNDIFGSCSSPIMRMASLVTQTHHEKWDGSGYPRGLAGREIPIEGRITAVADVFDALSTKRPYKEAIPLEKCFRLMEENRGTHFDPDVLDAFFRRKSEIVRIFEEYADNWRNFDYYVAASPAWAWRVADIVK